MNRQINQYRLLRLLGRGGMGRVYKAQNPSDPKIVALKVLAPAEGVRLLMPKSELRHLFLDEADILTRIQNDNVITVSESAMTTGGDPYYVMDYLGHHLGEIIGESNRPDDPTRALPLKALVHYMRQMFSGLACLHEAGIVHRDLKPANLLITADDTLKICDFGLAKTAKKPRQTPRGLKIGSPWYAAPEQEDKPDTVDTRADIYSVGVICHQLAYGHLPHRGTINNRPDLLPLHPFLKSALSFHPEARFSDVGTMAQAFDAVAREIHRAQQSVCAIKMSMDEVGASPTRTDTPLRSRCLKMDADQAARTLWIDPLWRPKSPSRRQWFENTTGKIITDSHTGLHWQQSGSSTPMTWIQARRYVRSLNKSLFGGIDQWRLPTAAELLSLVTRSTNDHPSCVASVFDARQKWLWSCDRKSYHDAWYVSVDLGYINCVDQDGGNYVRAVANDSDFAANDK